MCVCIYHYIYILTITELHFAKTSTGSTRDNATDSRIRHSKSPNWQWQDARCRKVVSVSASSNMWIKSEVAIPLPGGDPKSYPTTNYISPHVALPKPAIAPLN